MRLRKQGEPLPGAVGQTMKRSTPKNIGPKPCVLCGQLVKWSKVMGMWCSQDKAKRFSVTYCESNPFGEHKTKRGRP